MASPRMTVADRRHEMLRSELGHVCRQARENAGLSQRDLARQVGISHASVKDIEGAVHFPHFLTFLDIMYAVDADRSVFERIIDLHAQSKRDRAA